MKNKILKMIMTMALIGAMCVTSVNVNVSATESTPVEERYADILDLYKTVNEMIDELVRRDEYEVKSEFTYFVKSKNDLVDLEELCNILHHCTIEYYYTFHTMHSFEIDGWYYQAIRITTRRPYTSEDKIYEYANKVQFVENQLGLFSEELCDYEKIAIAFKYVVDNVEYGSYEGENNQYAYSALVKGKAVCSGYASFFQDVLNDVSIGNLRVTSDECSNPHAWNLVQLEDKWYYCDPTGSDPINLTVDTINKDGYVWFLDFMMGSIEDAKTTYHEVDTISTNTINYFNCNISEENLCIGSSIHNGFCKLNKYTAPTCTTTGVLDIECDYCNDAHRIEIPITHYYTHNITEATCTSEGYGMATCTLCNDSYNYTIPTTDHKLTYRTETMDCETDGYEMICCEDCDYVYWIDETPSCGHDWSEWVEASWTQYKKTCSNCDDVIYEKKSVIDGTETETTTKIEVSEEDKTPMDRGYGVVAYYSEKLGYWGYVDEVFGFAYVDGETAAYSSQIEDYVYWDEDTHTFITLDEYLAKKGLDSETTSKDVNATTTTEPTTTIRVDIPTTTVNPTTELQITINIPKTTVAEDVVIKNPHKVKIKNVKKKKLSAKKIEINVVKVVGATGYEIAVYKTKKHAKRDDEAIVVSITKKSKIVIKNNKLKDKKKLFVKVRAYIKTRSGKAYGKWSKVEKIKIK